ncbi:MAG: hypothetical protein R3E39_02560 [Anaerolineae bacterium]
MALTTHHEPSTINPTLWFNCIGLPSVLGIQSSELSSDDDAAAISEPTAALSPLQRLSPLFLPANCGIAAVRFPVPAVPCSGNYAT